MDKAENYNEFSSISTIAYTIDNNKCDTKSKRRPKQLFIPTTNKSPLLGSYRMWIVIMLMLHLFCTTSLRMNLGMALVCMVNSTAVRLLGNKFILTILM